MITQEIYYPQYYGEMRQIVHTSGLYHSTAYYHQHKKSDDYSCKIYHSKIGENKTNFFFPKIISLIDELQQSEKFSNIDFVTLLPSHKPNAFTSTLNGVGMKVANHLGVNFDLVLKKSKETKKLTSIESLGERYNNLKDSIFVVDEQKSSLNNKNILVLDDVKTTGITLMESRKALLECGAKNIFAVVFGINEN